MDQGEINRKMPSSRYRYEDFLPGMTLLNVFLTAFSLWFDFFWPLLSLFKPLLCAAISNHNVEPFSAESWKPCCKCHQVVQSVAELQVETKPRGTLGGPISSNDGSLRKGPPFHGSRSSREIKVQKCKLSNGWSRSYEVIKLCLAAGKWVVAKLQGDKSASQSSMELYYPWISGPLRVSWNGSTATDSAHAIVTQNWLEIYSFPRIKERPSPVKVQIVL